MNESCNQKVKVEILNFHCSLKTVKLKLCAGLCCSAWSSPQEGGGRCPQLNRHQSDLEGPPICEAAWPDQRLPAGLLPAGERGASRTAAHHGHLTS